MFDGRVDFRPRGIGPFVLGRQCLARRLAEMDLLGPVDKVDSQIG